jgi:hypothetical protein
MKGTKRIAFSALSRRRRALLRFGVDSRTLALAVIACLAVAGIATAEDKIYTNKKVGFTVSYPTNWSASATYQNAVEIRNQNASQRDTASVLVSWEEPVSTEQAAQRVKDLIEAASRGTDFHSETITTADGVLHFWTVLEPPAVPALKKAVGESRKLRRAGSALVGNWIVRAEGMAWEDADLEIIASMKKICRSLRLIR